MPKRKQPQFSVSRKHRDDTRTTVRECVTAFINATDYVIEAECEKIRVLAGLSDRQCLNKCEKKALRIAVHYNSYTDLRNDVIFFAPNNTQSALEEFVCGLELTNKQTIKIVNHIANLFEISTDEVTIC